MFVYWWMSGVLGKKGTVVGKQLHLQVVAYCGFNLLGQWTVVTNWLQNLGAMGGGAKLIFFKDFVEKKS